MDGEETETMKNSDAFFKSVDEVVDLVDTSEDKLMPETRKIIIHGVCGVLRSYILSLTFISERSMLSSIISNIETRIESKPYTNPDLECIQHVMAEAKSYLLQG